MTVSAESKWQIDFLLSSLTQLNCLALTCDIPANITEMEFNGNQNTKGACLTLYMLNFSEGRKTYINILCHSSTLTMTQAVEMLPQVRQELTCFT